MRSFLCFLACFLTVTTIYSQDRCGADQLMQIQFSENPVFQDQLNESFRKWKEEKALGLRSSIPVTIPVHVVLVHPSGEAIGTGSNLSLERVQSQIVVINQDFSRTNSNASETPAVFPASATEISFCLAAKDPNGNDTNGITRVVSNDEWDDVETDIMTANIWDRSRYLNIFVTQDIPCLGYSPVPNALNIGNANTDAVVCRADAFGGPGFATLAPYDLGRTATHEIGHWLGLLHIWGNEGCQIDDNIDDTPQQDRDNAGCPNHPSPSCSNSGDMFMNYMDYVNDECMSAFSAEQSDYMSFILENSRASLMNSAETACTILSIDPLTTQISTLVNASCTDSEDGRVAINVEGGTPPYVYSSTSILGESSGVINITGLAVGSYDVLIEDNNGMMTNVVFTIGGPAAIFLEVVAVTQPCSALPNGSFGVAATGGNPGDLSVTVNGNLSNPNNFFEGLAAGDYNIVARDEESCFEQTSFSLIDLVDPILVESIETSGPSCATDPNGGSAIIIASSANGIENYELDGTTSADGNFSGLGAGTYNYIVTDSRGCTFGSQLSIQQEDGLSASISSITPASCFGLNDGMVEIMVSNQSGTVTATIDGMLIDGLIGTDLPVGAHEITVVDDSGCEVNLNFEITEPMELIANISNITGAGCAIGGGFSVLGEGGVPPYLFSLDGGIPTQFGVFENIDAGNHEIIITDANECELLNFVNIPVSPSMVITVDTDSSIACFGDPFGQLEVNVDGGTPPFTYGLDGGTPTLSGTFTNITGGIHELRVSDASGCVEELMVEIQQPDELIFGAQANDVGCDGASAFGSIISTTTGGTPPYTSTIDGIEDNDGVFENLSGGTYVISITDNNGCSVSQAVVLSVSSPVTADINLLSHVTCFGAGNGSIDIITESSVPISSFDWNLPFSSEQSMQPGEYALTVTNADGCQDTAEVVITEPSQLVLDPSTNIQPLGCDDNIPGSIAAVANGGIPPYVYTLDDVSNTSGLFSPLEAGSYVLNVMDANACMISQAIELVDEGSPVTLNIENIENVTCNGGTDGNVTIIFDSEAAFEGLFWPGIENQDPTSLPAGDYTVVATNVDGCSDEQNFTITEPEALSLVSEFLNNYTDTPGSASFQMQGGVAPYTYSLQDPEFGPLSNMNGMFDELGFGIQTLLVTDSNGCTFNHDFEIELEVANDNLISDFDIEIYPNPTQQYLSVVCEECESKIQFQIISLLGQKVWLEGELNQDLNSISVESLETGTYLFKILHEGKRDGVLFVKI